MLISKSTFLHHMKKKKAVKAKHESISLARLSSSSWGILKVIGDRLKWDIYKPLLWAWGPLWNLHAVERGWKTSRGTRCQKTTSAASPSQRHLATEKCKANIYSFRCFLVSIRETIRDAIFISISVNVFCVLIAASRVFHAYKKRFWPCPKAKSPWPQ